MSLVACARTCWKLASVQACWWLSLCAAWIASSPKRHRSTLFPSIVLRNARLDSSSSLRYGCSWIRAHQRMQRTHPRRLTYSFFQLQGNKQQEGRTLLLLKLFFWDFFLFYLLLKLFFWDFLLFIIIIIIIILTLAINYIGGVLFIPWEPMCIWPLSTTFFSPLPWE